MDSETQLELLKKSILNRSYYCAPISDLKNLMLQNDVCPCCNDEKDTFIIPSHREYEMLCMDCLKTIDLTFAHNTEKGLVSKDPILFGQSDELDISIHVPLESIKKLMLTPNFDAPYDAPWLICCKDFMLFIGIWEASNFTRASETSGKELFMQMTDSDYNDLWDELELNDNEEEFTWTGIKYYAFDCPTCNTKRGNWEYVEDE